MRAFTALWVLVLLPSLAPAASTPESFADLVDKLSPTVVNIATTQKVQQPNGLRFQFKGFPEGEQFEPFRDFFERFGEQQGAQPVERDVTSLGSGFVIDPDGYVVTNHHVVAEADEVQVIFQDEATYDAKIVGRDAKTDLALLKIEANKKLPAVTFGDSDTMRVGDWVVAIGNPFGLGGSVSAGIISARSRNINAGPFDDFIQTDAAINRGNSGGPLFNVKGEVIGVNSAIFTPTGGNVGIGFAIPSAMAEPVLKQLREYGRTHRGWLGVKIQHVTDELAESLGLKNARGALVLEVNEGSPAEKAGILAGDVILQFDDRAIKEMRNLPRIVAENKVGKTVDVVVWRDEDEKALDVTLGEMQEDEDESLFAQGEGAPGGQPEDPKSQEWMGASVAVLEAKTREQLGLDKDLQGVVILQVETGSKAFDARLQRGDVIVEANQKKVDSVSELQDAIKAARKDGKSHALLRVSRRGNLSFITIATSE